MRALVADQKSNSLIDEELQLPAFEAQSGSARLPFRERARWAIASSAPAIECCATRL